MRASHCVLLSAGSVALQSLLDVLEESCRYFKTTDGRWVACVGWASDGREGQKSIPCWYKQVPLPPRWEWA